MFWRMRKNLNFHTVLIDLLCDVTVFVPKESQEIVMKQWNIYCNSFSKSEEHREQSIKIWAAVECIVEFRALRIGT